MGPGSCVDLWAWQSGVRGAGSSGDPFTQQTTAQNKSRGLWSIAGGLPRPLGPQPSARDPEPSRGQRSALLCRELGPPGVAARAEESQ